MTPKKDETKPVDRSEMTDRAQYMARSIHAPKVAHVAAYIAKHEKVQGPTDAVRRALRLMEIPDHYDADVDPTFGKCVELAKKYMDRNG